MFAFQHSKFNFKWCSSFYYTKFYYESSFYKSKYNVFNVQLKFCTHRSSNFFCIQFLKFELNIQNKNGVKIGLITLQATAFDKHKIN